MDCIGERCALWRRVLSGVRGREEDGHGLGYGMTTVRSFLSYRRGDLASQIHSASFPVKQTKPESLET